MNDINDTESNNDVNQIFELLKTNNVFITGPAGSGKSYILKKLIEKIGNDKPKGVKAFLDRTFLQSNNNVVVLAPTAVAALLVGGMTIHSFFKIKVFLDDDEKKEEEWWDSLYKVQLESTAKIRKRSSLDGMKGEPFVDKANLGLVEYYQEVYKKGDYKYRNSHLQWWCEIFDRLKLTKYIFIDEISMVSGKLFNNIIKIIKFLKPMFEHIKRDEPKIAIFGDFYQLPPVEKNSSSTNIGRCFNTPGWAALNLSIYYLQKIYRQENSLFVKCLNYIKIGRLNNLTKTFLKYLNKHNIVDGNKIDENSIYLVGRNKHCDDYNNAKVSNIKAMNVNFHADVEGDVIYQYSIIENGVARKTSEYNYNNYEGKKEKSIMVDYKQKIVDIAPVPADLKVKVGEKIILIKNKYEKGKLIYPNGLRGIIEEIHDDHLLINVNIKPGMRKNNIVLKKEEWKITGFEKNGESTTLASFKQYPIKPGYAITIHKSQGATFDSVVIDPDVFGGEMFTPMLYTALSRCKDYNNIYLTRPIDMFRLSPNEYIDKFYKNSKYVNVKDKLEIYEDFNINMLNDGEKMLFESWVKKVG